jgi:hypothetical protein
MMLPLLRAAAPSRRRTRAPSARAWRRCRARCTSGTARDPPQLRPCAASCATARLHVEHGRETHRGRARRAHRTGRSPRRAAAGRRARCRRAHRHAQLQPAHGRAPVRRDGPARSRLPGLAGRAAHHARRDVERLAVRQERASTRSISAARRTRGSPTSPDERVGEIAVDEFRTRHGLRRPRAVGGAGAMPAWDRSWAPSRARAAGGLHIHANWESRPGIPGRLIMARGSPSGSAGLTAKQPVSAEADFGACRRSGGQRVQCRRCTRTCRAISSSTANSAWPIRNT